MKNNYLILEGQLIPPYNSFSNYTYNFKLYKNDQIKYKIKVDDYVLVQNLDGYAIVKTTGIKTIEQELDYKNPTKEVICKLDCSNHFKRKADKERKKELLKAMKQICTQDEQLSIYKAVAVNNPLMASYVQEYEELERGDSFEETEEE